MGLHIMILKRIIYCWSGKRIVGEWMAGEGMVGEGKEVLGREGVGVVVVLAVNIDNN